MKLSNPIFMHIAGMLKAYDSPALQINSVPDHIHILFRLSKNIALAKIVEEIKKESSKWLKSQGREYNHFAWQIGYGAFSVSSSKLEVVKRYIRDQKEHHNVYTFQQGIESLLKHYDLISYDAEYFWR